MTHRRWRMYVLGPIAYLATAQVADLWSIHGDGSQVFWPAAGVAVTVVIGPANGRHLSVAAVTGAVGALFHALLSSGGADDVVVAAIAAGAGAVVGAGALARFAVSSGMRTPAMPLAMAAIAAVAASTSAAISVVALSPGDPWMVFSRTALASGVGILIVAPIAFLGSVVPVVPPHRWGRHELAVLVAGVVAVTVVAFSTDSPLLYLVIAGLIWAGLRGGPRVGLPLALGVVVLASVFTADGRGPMAAGGPDAAVQVEVFAASAAFSALVVASVVLARSTALARQQAVVDLVPDMIVLVDRNAQILWSQGTLGMDIPPGTPVADLVDAHFVDDAVAMLAKIRQAPDVVVMVSDKAVPGRLTEFRSRAVGDGTTVSVLRDVTRLVERAQEFDLAMDRWRGIVEAAYEGILEIDEASTVTYASPRFLEMTGKAHDDVVGAHLSGIFGDAGWDSIADARVATRAGENVTAETAYLTAAGDAKWGIVSATPQLDVDGVYRGALVFIADITALRVAENARRALLNEIAALEETERRSVAQDIHDGPLQDLAAANLMLGRLRAQPPSNVVGDLALVEASIQSTMDELRRGITKLDPAEIDHGGIADALRIYGERIFASSPTAFRVEASGQTPIGPPAVTAYRIAREAISNAARHADAASVTVRIRGGPGAVQLTVEDDGGGFDAQAEPPMGHLGIRSMTRRAVEVDGRLWIESDPNEGTRVRVTIPVTGRAESADEVSLRPA